MQKGRRAKVGNYHHEERGEEGGRSRSKERERKGERGKKGGRTSSKERGARGRRGKKGGRTSSKERGARGRRGEELAAKRERKIREREKKILF